MPVILSQQGSPRKFSEAVPPLCQIGRAGFPLRQHTVCLLPVGGYLQSHGHRAVLVDYSLQNTVRQVLFLPTTREEKYQAKQAIDTFFVRTGDVLSAVLVYVGTSFLAFQTKHFALVNLVLVVVWLVLAVLTGRENRKLAPADK